MHRDGRRCTVADHVAPVCLPHRRPPSRTRAHRSARPPIASAAAVDLRRAYGSSRCGPVAAPMWASRGADVQPIAAPMCDQSRRRCGPVLVRMHRNCRVSSNVSCTRVRSTGMSGSSWAYLVVRTIAVRAVSQRVPSNTVECRGHCTSAVLLVALSTVEYHEVRTDYVPESHSVQVLILRRRRLRAVVVHVRLLGHVHKPEPTGLASAPLPDHSTPTVPEISSVHVRAHAGARECMRASVRARARVRVCV